MSFRLIARRLPAPASTTSRLVGRCLPALASTTSRLVGPRLPAPASSVPVAFTAPVAPRRGGTGRLRPEAGMTTAEYAVGTLAACAFAVILLAVVRSPAVRDGLAKVITTALGMAG